jgi:uncharacterized protein YjiS (DUF1127 family)
MTEIAIHQLEAIGRDQRQTVFGRMLDRYKRRRDATVLARLDDHILQDIGLSRYDIEMLAKS